MINQVDSASEVARFGLVTSKAVGNAPTRNKVRRRLRAIAWECLDSCHGDFVIRALPNAATASWAELKAEVTQGLMHVMENER